VSSEPQDRIDALEQRLTVLEGHVRRILRRLDTKGGADGVRATPSAQPAGGPAAPAARPTSPATRAEPPRASPVTGMSGPSTSGGAAAVRAKAASRDRPARGADYWIARVGIGLLLFGVAFLFKYAVDKGWLTPAIRVGFGFALGAVLCVVGFRVPRTQRWIAPLMIGGGVATLYVTGYAAHEVFALVSYAVALTYMTLVTALAYVSAVRVREVTLAILATAAGLATPFVITSDAGTVLGAVTYESAIVIGAVAIVWVTGWTPLLWAAAVGGWASLGSVLNVVGDVPAADRPTMQVGIAVTWLATWAGPLVRRFLRSSDAAHADVGPLLLPTSLVAYGMTMAVWSPSDTANGMLALGGSLLFSAVWFVARPRLDERLTSLHAIAAAVFAALAIQFLMGAHTRTVTWALEGTLLLYASGRLSDRRMRFTANAVWFVVAMSFVIRLAAEPPTSGELHWVALADLAVVALAIASARLSAGVGRDAYDIAAAYGLGALVARELTIVEAGSALTIAAWGLIAGLLHRTGRTLGRLNLHRAGHAASVMTGIAFAVRLGSPAAGTPLIGVESVALLGALLLVGHGAMQLSDPSEKLGYGGILHVGVLGWFWYELVQLPVGHAWVSLAWGAYGVALLVLGLRRRLAPLRTAAFVTLGMLVGKLFLVDLRAVDPFWRIVLFLGFGGLFLALAYYFRSLWGTPVDAGAADQGE